MMPHNLDWEEGFRYGIMRCLRELTPIDRAWENLAQLLEESAARTDRILRDMEEKQ